MKKRQKVSGVRRPFINKRNRLMLGNEKRTIKSYGVSWPFVNTRNRLLGIRKRKIIRKQKGGFWGPLLGTLLPTATELVTKLIK